MSIYHYTQCLVGWKRQVDKRSIVLVDGKKQCVEYKAMIHGWKWFSYVTDRLVDIGIAKTTDVCGVETTSYPAKETVNAIVAWR